MDLVFPVIGWPSHRWRGAAPGRHPPLAVTVDRPVSLIGEGGRMKVFASDHGQYVIKLFKSPEEVRATFDNWGIDLALVEWSPRSGDALGTATFLIERALRSCALAFAKLHWESGLVHVQLRGGTPLYLEIRSDEGDETLPAKRFLVQYRAELFGTG